VPLSADPRAMAVGTPVIELQPHPETTRGEEWEILEHWRDAGPWEPPIRVHTLQEQVALEELTVVLTAALLRDFAKTRPSSLVREKGLILEVRPGGAGETLTVGTIAPEGFTMVNAGQNLWGR
jgi:hypothetical protein